MKAIDKILDLVFFLITKWEKHQKKKHRQEQVDEIHEDPSSWFDGHFSAGVSDEPDTRESDETETNETSTESSDTDRK